MSVVFLTDRDLGLKFPAILRDAGLRVERHADHFATDCPDEVWRALERPNAKIGVISAFEGCLLDTGAHLADTWYVMTAPTTPAIGTKLPFLFTYRDTLFGNGFIVEVQATNGRALCVFETDGCWMYGINPGGMSAVGEDPTTAHAAFRRTFSNILVDLALESPGFEAFQRAVSDFFNETNDGYEPAWLEAVQAVRNDEVNFEGIPRAPANSPRFIHVGVKQVVSAEDNRANFQPQLAA